jgi:hypothetical protein
MTLLTREAILDALERLDAELARRSVRAELFRTLACLLGLRTSGDVLGVVLEYFPEDRLPVRTRLLLEEMFDEGG